MLIFSLTLILSKTFYKYLNSFEINNSSQKYLSFIAIIILNILFIKNDALIIIFIFLSSLLLIKIKTVDKLNFAFIIFFVFFFKYLVFSYVNLNNYLQEDNYQNISVAKVLDFFNSERILLILKYLFFAFLDNPLFLIGGLFLAILFKNYKNNKFYLFILLSYLFSVLFIFMVFFLTSLPIEFHLKTAVSRVLFECSGFLLILIPIFFNKILHLKK